MAEDVLACVCAAWTNKEKLENKPFTNNLYIQVYLCMFTCVRELVVHYCGKVYMLATLLRSCLL